MSTRKLILRILLSSLTILFFAFTHAQQQPVIKVIVLGIAQDGGIPHIGCDQKICRTQRHFVSSLALLTNESSFLFDATPDLREQYAELLKRHPAAARKNLFDGIFLSHAHMGHYTGLLFLGKESVSTKNVPVYSSAEMAGYIKSNAPWRLLVTNSNIETHPFESGKAIELKGFSVTPLAVPHRKEFTDTHGFLIRGPSKSLLFIPDIDSWEPVRSELQRWLESVDYALLDGTFYSGDELPGRDIRLVPHPLVQTSVEFFKSFPSFSAKILFTHLNHTNPLLDPETEIARAFQKTGFGVATEWQEFEL